LKKEIMELELKHIAPYLPYGLKWTLQGLNEFAMSGVTHETLFTESGAVLTWPKHPDLPRALFPLLRPLSSLTKVIEVDGKKFVPINNLTLSKADSFSDFLDLSKGIKDVMSFRYWVVEKLFEWHFDVFGLIEEGLAVAIED
jgi:hypothetical protein